MIRKLSYFVCFLSLAGLLGTGQISAQERLTDQQLRHFETRIRPVLVESCYECHSSETDEPGGKLLLDSRTGILSGGVSGPAIVPGKPQSSLLLLAMQQTDPKLFMPPRDHSEKLAKAVIADFERWILAGAPDPRAESSKPATPAPSKSAWWAWAKPVVPSMPEVRNSDWVKSPLDRFVLAGLDRAGLLPNPTADRLTLVRRLAIDLTGLPPTIEDLKTYALDSDARPLESLIDQYIASDAFGERMGRHWLDVVRFAESSGKDVNIAFPEAWRYRDYVIDAFNADLPYKQFIVEQLAGDLLEHRNDAEAGRHLIATGMLAIGPKGLNERNPRQFAADVADEQIDAISQAFMATTIACARCHDHKFDPISQRDYTAMAGIFLSTKTHFGTTGGVGGQNRSSLLDLPEGFPIVRRSTQRSAEDVARARERITEIEAELADYRRTQLSGGADSVSAADRAKSLRLRQQLSRLQLDLDGIDEDGEQVAQAMGVSDKSPPPTGFAGRFRRNAATGVAAIQNRFVTRADTIADSPLLIRGEIDKPGDVIPRGLPESLAQDVAVSIGRDESGRMQLAQWIASPQNPLTARVMVNRVWSWLMGEGIVTTVDNFGTSGSLPSHPELLDYLASEFVKHNWSIKTLVKQIVMSSTYQQASDVRDDAFLVDPDNRLWWRANRKPMDAEALRDGLLAASGQLRLERPTGSLVAIAGNGPIGFRRGTGLSETAIVDVQANYRSVYLPVPRNVLPEPLELFDFADNSAVSGARALTISPSQALYWMNSSQVAEQCDAIARKLMAEHSLPRGERGRLFNSPVAVRERMFRMFESLTLTLLSRPPLDAEIAAVREYMQQSRRAGENLPEMWSSIARSVASSAEFRLVK
ncbi:MAG: PSD1 and planctomycete cytochrome C domain-containing protein [Pirellulaceae bacterium]